MSSPARAITRPILPTSRRRATWSPAVLKHHGRLDVLVNNAGQSIRIPHADLKAATPAVWRRMLDVNLIAPFVLVTEAEPALRKSAEGGRPACIVNIGTHAGVRPKGASIPYATAKAGLHHVTRLLALALGPAIRVNCVAPGLVETPMGANWPEATELWNTRSADAPACETRGHRRSGGRAGRQRLRYRRDRHRRWWAEPH